MAGWDTWLGGDMVQEAALPLWAQLDVELAKMGSEMEMLIFEHA